MPDINLLWICRIENLHELIIHLQMKVSEAIA